MRIDRAEDWVLLQLTGAGDADASKGTLYRKDDADRAEPDPHRRVLIVGLGGQGVKTVARIKREILSGLRYTDRRIAFAAIDTDPQDMRLYTDLDERDQFVIPTSAGIEKRYNVPYARTAFTRSWINPNYFCQSFADDHGCRQTFRAKLFDRPAADHSTDEQLTDWLRNKVMSLLLGYDEHTMRLHIHIIAGIAGGTGSGGVVEIAHLMRRVCERIPGVLVSGYLYLPDMVEEYQFGPGRMNLYANGYAALKELDYYHSVIQRDDVDYLYVNGIELPLAVSSLHPLYDMVYLVSGSNGPGIGNRNKRAIHTVTRFIAGQLGDVMDRNFPAGDGADPMDSFLAQRYSIRAYKLHSLYDPQGKEMPGVCGEDLFNYNAIGAATAAIPRQTIKMYAISNLLRTVSGRQDGFRPTADFKGFSQTPLTPVEAQSEIRKIFAVTPDKMEDIIVSICRASLHELTDLGLDQLKREDILSGNLDEQLRRRVDVAGVIHRAVIAVRDLLDRELDRSREAIRTFLKNEGPLAFAAMFRGTDPAGKHYELNFEEVLQGRRGMKPQRINVARTAARLEEARNAVAKLLVGTLPRYRAEWRDAFCANEVAKVADQVAHIVFEEGGLYYTGYVTKIDALSREILVFDYTLQKLYDAYDDMGAKFETHADFIRTAERENFAMVNLIETPADYRWAKQIVDDHGAHMAFDRVKEAIVDSFMADPKRWTEYDPSRPEFSPRREMDRIVADQVRFESDLNVATYIQHKLNDGVSTEDVARGILNALRVKAEPLYNTEPGYRYMVDGWGIKCLFVPQALFLNGEQGAQLMNSFTQFAAREGLKLFFVSNADDIGCYAMHVALPLYVLNDLPRWEEAYERFGLFVHSNESGQGDYDPGTGLAWRDYPSLCLKQDPRLPDEQGNVSRESMFFRNTIDPLFERGLRDGVIEEVEEEGRYSFVCCLDEDGTERRKIALLEQGPFSDPHPDREVARERAKRALRRNVPLFIALKRKLAAN